MTGIANAAEVSVAVVADASAVGTTPPVETAGSANPLVVVDKDMFCGFEKAASALMTLVVAVSMASLLFLAGFSESKYPEVVLSCSLMFTARLSKVFALVVRMSEVLNVGVSRFPLVFPVLLPKKKTPRVVYVSPLLFLDILSEVFEFVARMSEVLNVGGNTFPLVFTVRLPTE